MVGLKKVEAVPAMINGQVGYDIRVNDRTASVQDYINAVNSFIRLGKCCRSRNPEAESCYGCDSCCRERIPVTLIDALNLIDGGMEKTIENLFHVFLEGPVVDITMGLDEAGRCLLLDGTKRICRAYPKRPLVCRTFICCPSTQNARMLREEIVNAGEDELVRTWFNIRGKNGFFIIHEAVSPCPDVLDYPPTPFSGAADYRQVKLEDVCSPRLWRKLTVPKVKLKP